METKRNQRFLGTHGSENNLSEIIEISDEIQRKKQFIRESIPGVVFLVGDDEEIMKLYNFYKKIRKDIPFKLENNMLLVSNYFQFVKLCMEFNSQKFFKKLLENINFGNHKLTILEDCCRSKKYDLLKVLAKKINPCLCPDNYMYYFNNTISKIFSGCNSNILANLDGIKILSAFYYIKEYRDLLLENENTNKNFLLVIDILCGLKHSYLNIFNERSIEKLQVTDYIKDIILDKIISSTNTELKENIFCNNIDIYISYLDRTKTIKNN